MYLETSCLVHPAHLIITGTIRTVLYSHIAGQFSSSNHPTIVIALIKRPNKYNYIYTFKLSSVLFLDNNAATDLSYKFMNYNYTGSSAIFTTINIFAVKLHFVVLIILFKWKCIENINKPYECLNTQ